MAQDSLKYFRLAFFAPPEDKLKFEEYFRQNTIHLKALFAKSEKFRLIEEYGTDSYQETETGELLLECDFASYQQMTSIFCVKGFW